MTAAEDSPRARGIRQNLAGIGLLLGVAGIGAALLLPASALQTSSWTEADALRHQAVSGDLHRLSFARGDNKQAMDEMRAARVEFARIDARLVEASDAPRRWRALLLWGGGLLAIGAGVVLAAGRSG